MNQLGGKLTKTWIEKYAHSPNWKNGKFQNLVPTGMSMSVRKIPGIIYRQITTKGRSPEQPLPIEKFNPQHFLEAADSPKFIWFGHSAILLRIGGKTIFIDPMMGPDSAPIGPFRVRRFSEDTLGILRDLPAIDLVIFSHDHYDHLDMHSVELLKQKTSQFFVALGVERHLIRWGISANKITSFDWWDEHSFGDIEVHFTPSRHFSGRGLRDRFRCLWGGWVLSYGGQKIYFSGDSGYGAHFTEVGKRLGPFDLGFMECGQYNENWHDIHMFPEETVQAAKDARVNKTIPVHWGAFALALHSWKDPAQRFVAAAEKEKIPYMLPRLGQLLSINDEQPSPWWQPD